MIYLFMYLFIWEMTMIRLRTTTESRSQMMWRNQFFLYNVNFFLKISSKLMKIFDWQQNITQRRNKNGESGRQVIPTKNMEKLGTFSTFFPGAWIFVAPLTPHSWQCPWCASLIENYPLPSGKKFLFQKFNLFEVSHYSRPKRGSDLTYDLTSEPTHILIFFCQKNQNHKFFIITKTA